MAGRTHRRSLWATLLGLAVVSAIAAGTSRRQVAVPPAARQAPPEPRPRALPDMSWGAILRRTYAEFGADRVLSIAGGVTFFSLLALVPALTALLSVYGLFADRAEARGQMDALAGVLPADAAGLIGEQIEPIAAAADGTLTLASLAALGLAFWSANGGTKALIEALNIAYDATETRGFVRLNLVSLTFTLGGIVLALAMIAATAVLPAVLEAAALSPTAEAVLRAGRWPVLLCILLTALAALYRWGPDLPDARWRWISPGAVLAAGGVMAFSGLFSWYLGNFADYNKTYGSLGAVIGLMM